MFYQSKQLNSKSMIEFYYKIKQLLWTFNFVQPIRDDPIYYEFRYDSELDRFR